MGRYLKRYFTKKMYEWTRKNWNKEKKVPWKKWNCMQQEITKHTTPEWLKLKRLTLSSVSKETEQL